MTHWTLHCCIFAIFRVVWCTSSTNFLSQDPYKFFIYKNSLDYSTSWYNKAPNFSYPSSNTEFWFMFHGSMVSSVLIHFIVEEEIWSKPEFFLLSLNCLVLSYSWVSRTDLVTNVHRVYDITPKLLETMGWWLCLNLTPTKVNSCFKIESHSYFFPYLHISS